MLKRAEELTGKTIVSSEIIAAEYGRTYRQYLCLIFSDGTRHMMGVSDFTLYLPRPEVEQMKKAPNFFSPDDIADAVRRIEMEKRQQRRKQEEDERKKYEELKAKFAGKEQHDE